MAEPTGNQAARSRRGPWHHTYFSSHFNRPDQIRHLLALAMSKEQLECFDLETIRVQSGALSDAHVLTEKHSDLIVSCGVKGGGKIVISIVIEAKSSADSGLMRQLLSYMARLYSNDAPAVLALTVFHGKSAWRGEKSFYAFEHAQLPERFESQFRDYLIDFRSIFVSLGDPDVGRHLLQLPLKEQLVLQVLSEIWDATAASYVKWVDKAQRLPEGQLVEFIRSTFEYLIRVNKSVTVQNVRDAIEASSLPGDEEMAETVKINEDLMTMTVAEIESVSEKRGIEIGIQKGVEKGVVKGKKEYAQRMLLDGFDESVVRKYSGLSETEISDLKNDMQG